MALNSGAVPPVEGCMGMKLEIDGAVVETERQGSLLELMLEAGAFVDARCGGKGRCGKCRVAASGELSPPTEAERRLLSPAELADGIRLAYEANPLGDVQVRTLSRTDIGVELSGSAAEYPVDAPWSEGRSQRRMRRTCSPTPAGSRWGPMRAGSRTKAWRRPKRSSGRCFWTGRRCSASCCGRPDG